MKFIHLTDTHLVAPGRRLHGLDPQERLEACVTHVIEHHGDAAFCIVTGDVADAGEAPAYRAARSALARLPMPVHLLAGNHDDRDALLAAFTDTPRDPNGFAQQVVTHAAGHFILLDTLEPAQGSGGAFCDRRAAWLRERLAETDGAPVYLFMHHPPFDVGVPALDAIALADPSPFIRAVERAENVRHVFFGHVHRPVSGQWRGISFSTLFGTSHQTRLDFSRSDYLAYTAEPPAYAVVLIDDDRLVVHHCHFLEDVSDIKGPRPPG